MNKQDYLRTDSLDEEGFIHFSKEEQVEKAANFQDRDVNETLILGVEEDRLNSKLRFEVDRGELSNLYDTMNLGAVVSI